jgi:hypothetical protein
MKFKIYWLDGQEEVLSGDDIADAFTKAGYGKGAAHAVDYYEPLPQKQKELEVA